MQLYTVEYRLESEGVLTDLLQCSADLSKRKKEEAVVALTDLLLSLIPQESSAKREIVTHVFKGVLQLMTC